MAHLRVPFNAINRGPLRFEIDNFGEPLIFKMPGSSTTRSAQGKSPLLLSVYVYVWVTYFETWPPTTGCFYCRFIHSSNYIMISFSYYIIIYIYIGIDRNYSPRNINHQLCCAIVGVTDKTGLRPGIRWEALQIAETHFTCSFSE